MMKFKRRLQYFPKTASILPEIRNNATIAIPARNPYRETLRRDYPEPLIALLVFILGIWLWDHYFGTSEKYAPGTEEIALIKIDRDLRLADAMAADPPWIRWVAGVDDPLTARKHSLRALEKLILAESIGLPGLEAFAILKATTEQRPIPEMLAEIMQGQMLTTFNSGSECLADGRGTWWQAEFIRASEQTTRPSHQWQARFSEQAAQLRSRALLVRSLVMAVSLAGLVFIPSTLSTLSRGFKRRPGGYAGAWTIPLGSIVFLVATLAWIGFTLMLEIGISVMPGAHPAVGILFDSAARLLPALIALALLFRKSSHAIRVTGMFRKFSFSTVLGVFSILMLADPLLRMTLGSDLASEPGWGLSSGEAGAWGLVFAIISACILAPVVEEILYRGVLFRTYWNGIGLLPAALLSSFVFAILHFYDGYGLASVGLFGLACALLYAGTGSLAAAIVLHMLYNTSIKIPEWIIYHAPLT
jgi:membrane protease YdiL (CAAX protease family)